MSSALKTDATPVSYFGAHPLSQHIPYAQPPPQSEPQPIGAQQQQQQQQPYYAAPLNAYPGTAPQYPYPQQQQQQQQAPQQYPGHVHQHAYPARLPQQPQQHSSTVVVLDDRAAALAWMAPRPSGSAFGAGYALGLFFGLIGIIISAAAFGPTRKSALFGSMCGYGTVSFFIGCTFVAFAAKLPITPFLIGAPLMLAIAVSMIATGAALQARWTKYGRMQRLATQDIEM